MKRIILGFTGGIASGKTTLSQHVRQYVAPGTGVLQKPLMVQQGGPRCSSCNMTLPRGMPFSEHNKVCPAKRKTPNFPPGYVPTGREMTSLMKKIHDPREAVIVMEEWIRDYPEAINVIVFSCFLNRLRSDPMLLSMWFRKMRDLNFNSQ